MEETKIDEEKIEEAVEEIDAIGEPDPVEKEVVE
jgi:hypothetical protein